MGPSTTPNNKKKIENQNFGWVLFALEYVVQCTSERSPTTYDYRYHGPWVPEDRVPVQGGPEAKKIFTKWCSVQRHCSDSTKIGGTEGCPHDWPPPHPSDRIFLKPKLPTFFLSLWRLFVLLSFSPKPGALS